MNEPMSDCWYLRGLLYCRSICDFNLNVIRVTRGYSGLLGVTESSSFNYFLINCHYYVSWLEGNTQNQAVESARNDVDGDDNDNNNNDNNNNNIKSISIHTSLQYQGSYLRWSSGYFPPVKIVERTFSWYCSVQKPLDIRSIQLGRWHSAATRSSMSRSDCILSLSGPTVMCLQHQHQHQQQQQPSSGYTVALTVYSCYRALINGLCVVLAVNWLAVDRRNVGTVARNETTMMLLLKRPTSQPTDRPS